MLDRCPSPYETEVYAGIHRLPNARINELIRELAMLPEFELKFIANNSHAVDNLYLKILGRASNPGWLNSLFSYFSLYIERHFSKELVQLSLLFFERICVRNLKLFLGSFQ